MARNEGRIGAEPNADQVTEAALALSRLADDEEMTSWFPLFGTTRRGLEKAREQVENEMRAAARSRPR